VKRVTCVVGVRIERCYPKFDMSAHLAKKGFI
jgi:hypothetical protein